MEEKKRFQESVVSQIDVKSVDKQNHELKLQFTFPYVGDKFVYDNPDRKQDGYTIKNLDDGEKGYRRIAQWLRGRGIRQLEAKSSLLTTFNQS